MTLTRNLLTLVVENGALHSIILALDAIRDALGIVTGLGSFLLSLAGSVLLLPGVNPGLSAGCVTDGFDDVALYRVVLASILAKGV